MSKVFLEKNGHWANPDEKRLPIQEGCQHAKLWLQKFPTSGGNFAETPAIVCSKNRMYCEFPGNSTPPSTCL